MKYTSGPYSQKKNVRNIFVFTESAVRNRPREIFRLIFTDVIYHNTSVFLTRVCSFNRSVCYKNKLIRLSLNAGGTPSYAYINANNRTAVQLLISSHSCLFQMYYIKFSLR